MYELKIDLSGSKETKKMLKDLAVLSKDMKPFFKDTQTDIEKLMGKVFANEGLPKWKPRKDKLPHKRLQKTGRLRRSFTDEGAEGAHRKISKTALEYGSGVMVGSYNLAALHHYETKNRPARQIFTRMVENAIKVIVINKLKKFYKKTIKEGR